jgi:hypothetical protein
LNWQWIARRIAISVFVLFHISAVSIWTMPSCAIKDRFQAPYRYYMLPLGLWQWWAIFAPEPLRENRILEVEVIDAKRLIHVYQFTTLADLTWAQRFVRYRHPKFTDNMVTGGEYGKQREFTARHAVRQLGLDEAAFPMSASLYVKIKDCPPAGTIDADPMAPPRIVMLERFEFASKKEVCP